MFLDNEVTRSPAIELKAISPSVVVVDDGDASNGVLSSLSLSLSLSLFIDVDGTRIDRSSLPRKAAGNPVSRVESVSITDPCNTTRNALETRPGSTARVLGQHRLFREIYYERYRDREAWNYVIERSTRPISTTLPL